MVENKIITHVTKEHEFKNEILFYRFTEHEQEKGPDRQVTLLPSRIYKNRETLGIKYCPNSIIKSSKNAILKANLAPSQTLPRSILTPQTFS